MNKRQNYILTSIDENWKYYFRNKMTLEDTILDNPNDIQDFISNKYNIIEIEEYLNMTHNNDPVVNELKNKD